MPKNAQETSQPEQESSQEAPIALQTRNDLSTLDNPQQDELPDLVTVKTGKDTGTEVTLQTILQEIRKVTIQRKPSTLIHLVLRMSWMQLMHC